MTTKTQNEKTVFADLIAAELEWLYGDHTEIRDQPDVRWNLETVSVTIDVSDCEFIPLEVRSRDATEESKAPWTAELIAVGDGSAEYVTQQDFSA